jgi:hypothetical protein
MGWLGDFLANDPEYAALKNDISKLKKQLKGSEDTTSAFSTLKAGLEAFLKRKSDRRTSSTSEQTPKNGRIGVSIQGFEMAWCAQRACGKASIVFKGRGSH